MAGRLRYFLLNKPYDVLTQFTGEPGQRTLRQYFPVPDMYPVGRLDRDSEGLVLLTNDGPLQHRWSDPRFHQPKKYWAQVEGIPDTESIGKLCAGVKLKDGITKPAKARLLEPAPEVPARVPPIRHRAAIPTAWMELVLTEGRNRQVRRMTATVGFPTLRLIRVAIGELELTGLAPGEWKEISRP